jgi:hypothetical protein
MKVYISGPMTGLPHFNAPAFNEAATTLRSLGFDVINPAELDAADLEPKEWHEYLRRDLVELVKCDAVALLPGWQKSKGARLELHNALELGMDVRPLEDWLPAFTRTEAAADSAAQS